MNYSMKIATLKQYIPTLNCMGYMTPTLDHIQEAFIEHCSMNHSGHYLDIGCGFGLATLPVIEKGCHIIACDLESKHLKVLNENVSEKNRNLLTVMTGHFPDELTFPKNHFDGINFSMVLHFFSPNRIEKVFQELFFCLKPGGRLFLTTSSPYQGVLSSFIPVYEQKRLVEEWPGYIPDISKYVPHRAHLLPKENIVFCIHELRRLASKFNFHIVEATFFSRESIPLDLSLDGREYSGIICEKPLDETSALLEKNKEVMPTLAAKIK